MATKKPNTQIIWGDDIGWPNLRKSGDRLSHSWPDRTCLSQQC
jgi:hypothetical protein